MKGFFNFNPGENLLKRFRLTNTRKVSQSVFFILFILLSWVAWTSRIKGYPVSWFLEIDPLLSISTAISTGFLYRNLGWSLFVIFLTLLFGRVFCNWMCPLGTLNQFVGWLFIKITRKESIDKNRYSKNQVYKYLILFIFLILSFYGSIQVGLLDPIVLLSRALGTVFAPASDYFVSGMGNSTGLDQSMINLLKFAPGTTNRIFVGSFWIGVLFLSILAANLFYPRFFCRFLCPLGALLGIFSRFSIFQIKRNIKKCTDCDLCLSRCEGASEPEGSVRVSECVSCMNCIDDCPEDALEFSFTGIDNREVQYETGVSRRQFIISGLSGLIIFPVLRNNGRVNDENFSPLLIRPPGSVAESEFLKKCIKCGQCMDICPTNVLQPATMEEGGFEALWTPVMNFNINHCQLKCNLCSEVCPTGSIRKITVAEKLGRGKFKEKGPVRLGTAFINRSRCLPWANQIPCVVCEEVCPTSPRAIQTRDEEVKDVFGRIIALNKPFIVPDLCIGCGICQARCPVADKPAVYVTSIGESRSDKRSLLLKYRNETK